MAGGIPDLPVEGRADDLAARRHGELADHRETVDVRAERGEIGGEPLGQHRVDAARHVHGGGVGRGVLVDRGAARHQGIHIGDADRDLDRAVGQPLGDLDLVQVHRVVVVDGGPEEAAQVADAGAITAGGLGAACLLHRGRRELRLEAVVDHRLTADELESAAIRAGVPGRAGARVEGRALAVVHGRQG
jgi:hypothetical protein